MLLHLESISKSYGSEKARNHREVLSDISFGLSQGGSLAILGPSGSGKTTLLNIIGSLDHSDSGSVFFNGTDISSFNEKQRDQYRNNELGFIFQLHHLLPQCSLQENLLIPVLNLKDKNERQMRQDRAISLMKRVGVYEFRDQKPGQLSGGECQRAAVIRAMINSPSLLLADEPTGALDADNAERLADLLLEINQTDRVALIVVTHSRSLAERMGSIYELKNGHLIKKQIK